MSLSRRSFLSALAALPIVGRIVAKRDSSKMKLRQPGLTWLGASDEQLDDLKRNFNSLRYRLAGSTGEDDFYRRFGEMMARDFLQPNRFLERLPRR